MSQNQASKLESGILELLHELHEGDSMTSLDLQFELLPLAQDPTCRAVRRAIKNLNRRGYPVISTQSGFHLAKTWPEVAEYRANLLGRAQKIMARIKLLDLITAERFSVPAQGETVEMSA